jgi:hypothetical protein
LGVVTAVLVGLLLAACAPSNDPDPVAATTPPPVDKPTTEPPPTPTEDAAGETPLRIVIGEVTLQATLWDNPAAQSLLAQLPLTLEFSDYGGQEVLAEPPQPITMKGMPDGESAPTGTIGYYAPGGVIVLYYTDVGHYNGIVRLGHIDGDVSVLRGWNEARSVTIERAD